MDLVDQLDVAVREVAGELAVKVCGEVDVATAPQLADYLEGLGTRTPVALDLSGVSFFDAAGLATLLAARERGLCLRLVDTSPIVRRVLELYKTTDLLE